MRGRRRSSATSWVVFQWMCRVVFKWEAQKLHLPVNSEPADCETQNSELRNSWSDLVQSAVDRLNMNKAWTLQTTDARCYNSAWLETYNDLHTLLYKMKCAQRCVEQQNSCLRIYKWDNYIFFLFAFYKWTLHHYDAEKWWSSPLQKRYRLNRPSCHSDWLGSQSLSFWHRLELNLWLKLWLFSLSVLKSFPSSQD